MQELDILKDFLIKNNYSDVEDKINKFGVYFDALIDWNNKFNLTSITDIKEVQTKHFIDSLLGNEFIQKYSKICDIGCGAGFPSIPLAIVNPGIKFTLVDSVNKKISFINNLIPMLSLKNVDAIHSRVEDFAKLNFEKFDCCVARALAQMPTLAEYTLPLIKSGGVLVAYKGINYQEELNNSNKIFNILNSKIDSINEFNLTNDEKRYVIVVKKLKNCQNKYPRGGNKPRTQPIIG
ncbi:MAG: 16S rRNA (guanine(527)-N(7))-methyltransferase RsmG [Clostridia bacterium]|nr:16S rRNA (guanine(527)-N(7))-methyltransferase RsmG [Clostridia bacterium]